MDIPVTAIRKNFMEDWTMWQTRTPMAALSLCMEMDGGTLQLVLVVGVVGTAVERTAPWGRHVLFPGQEDLSCNAMTPVQNVIPSTLVTGQPALMTRYLSEHW